MADRIRQPKKQALQAKFLAALVQTGGNILRAAEAVPMNRQMHYEWLANDPGYPERFAVFWEHAMDTLESEAARRAYEGVEEPVFNAGKRALDVVVGADGEVQTDAAGEPIMRPAAIRKYSDTLLIFLLNGNRSRKYRNRTDSRFVDAEGKDLKAWDLETMRAYIRQAPPEGEDPALG